MSMDEKASMVHSTKEDAMGSGSQTAKSWDEVSSDLQSIVTQGPTEVMRDSRSLSTIPAHVDFKGNILILLQICSVSLWT